MDLAPLAGYTVAVTAARRREELGQALQRQGAQVRYGPAIQIVPLADDTELLAATRRCVTGRLDHVIATTGIGFRGWLDAAEVWGLTTALDAALREATIFARGPKAKGAVRAAGLRESWSPEGESSDEVLEQLLEHHELSGRRIAVQLHGEPLTELVEALRAAGAEVIELPVYRWAPPADERPLRSLIDAAVANTLDCVTFTSAPAATNLLRTAQLSSRGAELHSALRERVLCAAVGPTTAAPLLREGIPVVQPARFRLGALVREVAEQLPSRAPRLQVAGHRLQLRGHAVVLDGSLVPLPSASMTLLRELASAPGKVLAPAALADRLPGIARDRHAVEVAVGRLRAALGDPAIIATVVKRGYRLAVDDG